MGHLRNGFYFTDFGVNQELERRREEFYVIGQIERSMRGRPRLVYRRGL